MRVESWIRCWCPKCNADNWINNGDPSDQTVSDVEAIRCHSCGHEAMLDQDWTEDETILEDVYIEDGECFVEKKTNLDQRMISVLKTYS